MRMTLNYPNTINLPLTTPLVARIFPFLIHSTLAWTLAATFASTLAQCFDREKEKFSPLAARLRADLLYWDSLYVTGFNDILSNPIILRVNSNDNFTTFLSTVSIDGYKKLNNSLNRTGCICIGMCHLEWCWCIQANADIICRSSMTSYQLISIWTGYSGVWSYLFYWVCLFVSSELQTIVWIY